MTYIWMAVAVLIVLFLFAGIVALGAAIMVVWSDTLYDTTRARVLATITGVVGMVLCLAGAIAIIENTSDDRPCVREETTYQYNPATKTVMPVTSCAERGEWVNE